MQRLIWTILVAFALSFVLGPLLVPRLQKLKFGQTIYELAPQSHLKKQGTPTMGGLIFIPAALIAGVVFARGGTGGSCLPMILVSALGFGAIGFVDDFIKVKLQRHEGLTPIQKLIPQVILSVGLAFWAYFTPGIGSELTIPFFHVEWNPGWFYIPLMVFVLVGTVNSANLLDGLDGLCAGCSMIDFFTMMLISFLLSQAGDAVQRGGLFNTAVFAAAMGGALLAFLGVNGYPARIFMGDVGSFFIGGALVGMALVTRLTLLLPVIALAMLVSSLSDIIQISYYRYTRKKYGKGKRVFRMAPLHHHFELSGVPETRVVTMYYLVTAALCLLSLLGFVR